MEEGAAAKTPSMRVLAFKLGKENYCADIRQIKEVVKAASVTEVPNTPELIAGIMNLRGQILTLVDLRRFFSCPAPVLKQGAPVIISDAAKSPVGLIVDDTKESVDIDEGSIQPPLETIGENLLRYTKGQVQYNGEMMAVIDLKAILESEEINRIRKGG